MVVSGDWGLSLQAGRQAGISPCQVQPQAPVLDIPQMPHILWWMHPQYSEIFKGKMFCSLCLWMTVGEEVTEESHLTPHIHSRMKSPLGLSPSQTILRVNSHFLQTLHFPWPGHTKNQHLFWDSDSYHRMWFNFNLTLGGIKEVFPLVSSIVFFLHL